MMSTDASSHFCPDDDFDNDFYEQLPEMAISEPLAHVIESAQRPGEVWLWCIDCNRFFQAKDLRRDFCGNQQGCAFCSGAGFDVVIFHWDAFRDEDDPAWPADESEIRYGQMAY
jgi:hypothetical protein